MVIPGVNIELAYLTSLPTLRRLVSVSNIVLLILKLYLNSSINEPSMKIHNPQLTILINTYQVQRCKMTRMEYPTKEFLEET